MPELRRVLMQLSFYAVFFIGLGYFSANPTYIHHDPNRALIKISFSHAGEPKEDCRRLTQEELNKLAPNMRRPTACRRERVSLLLEVELDNELLLREKLAPTGLAGDGSSHVYRRIPVAAGTHLITTRLRDSRRTEGFDYTYSDTVILKPKQNLIIDFDPELGGFLVL